MKADNKERIVKKLIISIGLVTLIIITLVKIYNNSVERNKIYSGKEPDKPVEEIVEPDPEEILKQEAAKKDENVSKNSIPAEEVAKMLSGTYEGNDEKIVFLTFDDGPSGTNTPKVLDILSNYGVKGTFFLLGENIDKNDENKEIVKRMYNEGHSIANHTYTHNTRKLYPGNYVDVNTFISEVDQTNNSLKAILGKYFNTRVVRMPGGYMTREYYKDPNLQNLNNEFNNKGLVSIDWNALSRDSEGKVRSPEQLLEETKKTSKGKDKVVILMHDTYGKETSVQALPGIIEYFSSNGYKFKTIK